METFQEVLGQHSDASIHDRLHALDHEGKVVRLKVRTAELGRRRFKAVDGSGVEYGVALARDAVLRNGSVLFLSDERAVVIDADDGETLTLRATGLEGAMQLGWHAGHLHWRVRMDGDTMTVLLDAPAEEYLARIADWISRGAIEAVAPLETQG